MKKITLQSLLLIFVLGFSVAQAQTTQENISVGYVDPQAVLNKMPSMKAVQQKMSNYVDKKRKELGQRRQSLQKQAKQFQSKQAVLSNAAKKKQQDKLGKLNQQFQKYQSKVQQQIQQKRQELVSPLLTRINTAVSTVADEMDLTYVINTTTSQGDVVILYASDEAKQNNNITQKVMDELDL